MSEWDEEEADVVRNLSPFHDDSSSLYYVHIQSRCTDWLAPVIQ
jgi:hypothetical protein